jgi:formylmethanofuran dehydrogenase subunit C
MTLVLRPRGVAALRLDLSMLRADAVPTRTLDQWLRLRTYDAATGEPAGQLGEWFTITGSTADPRLRIEADCGRCVGLGRGQRGGRLTIEGHAGDCLAAEMRGGEILVAGLAGHYVATGLRGGRISIRGDAGDFLGGPVRGGRRGMRGGVIWVGGDVGGAAGWRMRRGLMLLSGSAAGRLAREMVAGTIVLLGRGADDAGWGMRRGTLLLCGCRPELAAERFSPQLPAASGFPELLGDLLSDELARHAARWGEDALQAWPRAWRTRRWQRRQGDLAVGGLGEILMGTPSERGC